MDRLILLALFVACQFAHLVASAWALVAIVTGSPRALRIIIAYDRVGNAATGGLDTETISSRANRGTIEGRRGWCILCRLLDRLDPDHCKKSAGY
ncbi:hypothetical protein QN362_00320 [Actimicrobium sp. CCC2.4]|uniref:hypothetical protein n=1 Tax=Actimicrobium sp. CCC2.4 TaxID=3048606 RepID=UPI002AC8E7E4|nr:hypothetical protein [Actimicrobium sp. CCC2.4]MEB0133769.1 hypothetical protein [Actimicrobium sp. CCC2.4]WPX31312.1 hypothetical protein RHM62_13800 [Actimicrobium sp. CCC2.4]